MFLCRISTVIALVATLIGCVTSVPLQRAQIDAISRDSSSAAVEKVLGVATPIAEFEFTANDHPYFVRNYLLQTGIRQEMTMACTNICIPVFYDVPVTAQYLVVQSLPSRAMHAWGTIEELSKGSESDVSSIMPALKARLDAVLEEKKK